MYNLYFVLHKVLFFLNISFKQFDFNAALFRLKAKKCELEVFAPKPNLWSSVMRTKSLNLTCMVKGDTTNKNVFWKTCKWTRNSDNVSCTYRSNSNGNISKTQCHTLLKKNKFERESNLECKMINPSVEFADGGNWTCRMKTCKNVDDAGCEDQNSCVGEASVYIRVLNLFGLIRYKNSKPNGNNIYDMI